MKKTLLALTVAALIAMPAYAATTQTVNVSATVNSTLDLTMTIYKLDNAGKPIGLNLGTTMSFGTLFRDTVNSVMRGNDAYTVYLNANTSSLPYVVKCTMPALSNNTVSLPPAMVMTVVSATSAGVDIAGDTFTAGGQNAIMTNQTIYTSNPGGTAAFIQLVYGISSGNLDGSDPFTGWQPILLGQASGDYTAAVVYTMSTT